MSEDGFSLPHPRALAFLGDAVFEIYLREMAVKRGLSQSRDLHDFTIQRARAEGQVSLLHRIMPHLTEAEQEIIRQGRNLPVSSARRSGQSAYRQATGFEALLGALYLTDQKRLEELWHVMKPLLEAEPINLPEDIPDAN